MTKRVNFPELTGMRCDPAFMVLFEREMRRRFGLDTSPYSYAALRALPTAERVTLAEKLEGARRPEDPEVVRFEKRMAEAERIRPVNQTEHDAALREFVGEAPPLAPVSPDELMAAMRAFEAKPSPFPAPLVRENPTAAEKAETDAMANVPAPKARH